MFLRDFAAVLCQPICSIFISSIREGIVPLIRKSVNVITIPKVHPPRNIESDLRLISLVPTIAKLLESIIGSWILEAIELHINRYQFGSIKGKSTTLALADMVNHWCQAMDNKQPVTVLFIDFEKAFDRFSHNLVIDKFKSFNINPIPIRLLCYFLSNRRQRTKISTLFTEWLTLNGAMPQGSWPGPLCFVSLINALRPTCLTYKSVDDTTLSENSKKMVTTPAKFKKSCLPLEYNGFTIEQVFLFQTVRS